MISRAYVKAATRGFQIELHVMDAAFPQLSHQQFDVQTSFMGIART
jgi:hypothetical protein